MTSITSMCPTCGAKYGQGEKFCDNDGSALVVSELPRELQEAGSFCPSCRAIYHQSEKRFCNNDGTQLIRFVEMINNKKMLSSSSNGSNNSPSYVYASYNNNNNNNGAVYGQKRPSYSSGGVDSNGSNGGGNSNNDDEFFRWQQQQYNKFLNSEYWNENKEFFRNSPPISRTSTAAGTRGGDSRGSLQGAGVYDSPRNNFSRQSQRNNNLASSLSPIRRMGTPGDFNSTGSSLNNNNFTSSGRVAAQRLLLKGKTKAEIARGIENMQKKFVSKGMEVVVLSIQQREDGTFAARVEVCIDEDFLAQRLAASRNLQGFFLRQFFSRQYRSGNTMQLVEKISIDTSSKKQHQHHQQIDKSVTFLQACIRRFLSQMVVHALIRKHMKASAERRLSSGQHTVAVTSISPSSSSSHAVCLLQSAIRRSQCQYAVSYIMASATTLQKYARQGFVFRRFLKVYMALLRKKAAVLLYRYVLRYQVVRSKEEAGIRLIRFFQAAAVREAKDSCSGIFEELMWHKEEEDARMRAEEEARHHREKLSAEEEAAKKKEEEERAEKHRQEQERRKKEEEEQRRRQQEEEERRRQEEEEERRRKQQEEEEEKKRLQEEEARRLKEESERRIQEEVEKRLRQRLEEEKAERERKQKEEDEARAAAGGGGGAVSDEEVERLRKAKEQADLESLLQMHLSLRQQLLEKRKEEDAKLAAELDKLSTMFEKEGRTSPLLKSPLLRQLKAGSSKESLVGDKPSTPPSRVSTPVPKQRIVEIQQNETIVQLRSPTPPDQKLSRTSVLQTAAAFGFAAEGGENSKLIPAQVEEAKEKAEQTDAEGEDGEKKKKKKKKKKKVTPKQQKRGEDETEEGILRIDVTAAEAVDNEIFTSSSPLPPSLSLENVVPKSKSPTRPKPEWNSSTVVVKSKFDPSFVSIMYGKSGNGSNSNTPNVRSNSNKRSAAAAAESPSNRVMHSDSAIHIKSSSSPSPQQQQQQQRVHSLRAAVAAREKGEEFVNEEAAIIAAAAKAGNLHQVLKPLPQRKKHTAPSPVDVSTNGMTPSSSLPPSGARSTSYRLKKRRAQSVDDLTVDTSSKTPGTDGTEIHFNNLVSPPFQPKQSTTPSTRKVSPHRYASTSPQRKRKEQEALQQQVQQSGERSGSVSPSRRKDWDASPTPVTAKKSTTTGIAIKSPLHKRGGDNAKPTAAIPHVLPGDVLGSLVKSAGIYTGRTEFINVVVSNTNGAVKRRSSLEHRRNSSSSAEQEGEHHHHAHFVGEETHHDDDDDIIYEEDAAAAGAANASSSSPPRATSSSSPKSASRNSSPKSGGGQRSPSHEREMADGLRVIKNTVASVMPPTIAPQNRAFWSTSKSAEGADFKTPSKTLRPLKHQGSFPNEESSSNSGVMHHLEGATPSKKSSLSSTTPGATKKKISRTPSPSLFGSHSRKTDAADWRKSPSPPPSLRKQTTTTKKKTAVEAVEEGKRESVVVEKRKLKTRSEASDLLLPPL